MSRGAAVRELLLSEELDPLEINDYLKDKAKIVEMDPQFLNRSFKEGYSCGEKKRKDILQIALLEQNLSILDETD